MAGRTAGDPLATLLANAEKKYGSPVGGLTDIATDTKFISTGNIMFDWALGGGIPLGRSTELAGPPSCGKTTLASQVVANLQRIIKDGGDPSRGIKADDVILYVDFENAVDPEYLVKLGIDPDHEGPGGKSLRFTQPDYLEDGAQLILDVLRTGRIRLVVVDSVAAMNPRAVAEADVGKSLPAIVAKILTPWGTTLTAVLKEHNASIIFINHEKEILSMGGRPGMPAVTNTAGGQALKYFASQRCSFRQVKKNSVEVINPLTREKENRVTSIDVRMNVVKNKVAPPYRKAVARVRENRGFDNFWSALAILLAQRLVVAETGGMFYFHRLAEYGLVEDWMSMSAAKAKTPPRPYIRGQENVYSMADKHPEWRDNVILFTETLIPDLTRIGTEEDLPDEDEPDDLEVEQVAKGNRAEI